MARARFAHQEIDRQIEVLFQDPAVARHSSCKRGCSACCHSQVSINQDEAELLALKVLRGEITIDIARLAKQKDAGDAAAKWYQIAYKERGCVFLDDDGACQIYANRPGVCRTNYAVSAPELCSTEDGVEKPHRLLTTQAADMVLAASFIAAKAGGAMPRMLWDAIAKLEKQRAPKKPSLLAERKL